MKNDRIRQQPPRQKRRGPKHPLPSRSTNNTLQRNNGNYSDNSIYTYAVLNSGSSDLYGSKLSATDRSYIDPWDLENYDYVRKKLSSPSMEGSSYELHNSTPSPAGEPITPASDFFYLPNNNKDECPGCYAQMDEETFYNKKYESIYDDNEYPMYSDFESPYSIEHNNSSSCEEENLMSSSLLLHSPGFKASYGRRKMVLPKPPPKIIEFPKPPPYTDYSPYSSYIPCCDVNGYCSVPNCYECESDNERDLYTPKNLYGESPNNYIIPVEEIYGPAADASIYGYVGTGGSLYGQSESIGSSSLYSTLNRFALSKKGLLQIDYSCNWNDLDRYIAKEF